MKNKSYIYEIRVEEQLSASCSDWFEGLKIQIQADGRTTLSGYLLDQAALIGLLNKIHAFNLTLVGISRQAEPKER